MTKISFNVRIVIKNKYIFLYKALKYTNSPVSEIYYLATSGGCCDHCQNGAQV